MFHNKAKMLMYGKGTRMNLLFRFQCSQKPLLSCTINIKIRRSYDMKQPPRQRTIKDERDEKIEKDAKVYAFEWIIAITQVLRAIDNMVWNYRIDNPKCYRPLLFYN